MTLVPEPATLYLSRLPLNLRSRQVQRDLANSQALHRQLLDAFPGAVTRADVDLLYRVEASQGGGLSGYRVLVQSSTAPDWSRLEPGYLRDHEEPVGWLGATAPAVKGIGGAYARIGLGDGFRFRLRANPTTKTHLRPEESARPCPADQSWLGDAGMHCALDFRSAGPAPFPARTSATRPGPRWDGAPVSGGITSCHSRHRAISSSTNSPTP